MTFAVLVSLLFVLVSASLVWCGIVLHRQRKRRRERLTWRDFERLERDKTLYKSRRSIQQAPLADGSRHTPGSP